MKKVLSLFFTLLLIISLAFVGCGSTEEKTLTEEDVSSFFNMTGVISPLLSNAYQMDLQIEDEQSGKVDNITLKFNIMLTDTINARLDFTYNNVRVVLQLLDDGIYLNSDIACVFYPLEAKELALQLGLDSFLSGSLDSELSDSLDDFLLDAGGDKVQDDSSEESILDAIFSKIASYSTGEQTSDGYLLVTNVNSLLENLLLDSQDESVLNSLCQTVLELLEIQVSNQTVESLPTLQLEWTFNKDKQLSGLQLNFNDDEKAVEFSMEQIASNQCVIVKDSTTNYLNLSEVASTDDLMTIVLEVLPFLTSGYLSFDFETTIELDGQERKIVGSASVDGNGLDIDSIIANLGEELNIMQLVKDVLATLESYVIDFDIEIYFQIENYGSLELCGNLSSKGFVVSKQEVVKGDSILTFFDTITESFSYLFGGDMNDYVLSSMTGLNISLIQVDGSLEGFNVLVNDIYNFAVTNIKTAR